MSGAELCNGSTADSDSVCEGSNPSSATIADGLLIIGLIIRGVAQFGRVLGSGPRGRGFESRHSDHFRKLFKHWNNPLFKGFFLCLNINFNWGKYAKKQVLDAHFAHTNCILTTYLKTQEEYLFVMRKPHAGVWFIKG